MMSGNGALMSVFDKIPDTVIENTTHSGGRNNAWAGWDPAAEVTAGPNGDAPRCAVRGGRRDRSGGSLPRRSRPNRIPDNHRR